jgi:quercetin dioxygenase-like cupin family protein
MKIPERAARCTTAVLLVGMAALFAVRAWAQPEPGGVCRPVSERTSEVGCWILAHDDVGVLSQPAVFWHLAAYPTRAAAESAKGPGDTVVESLGKIWVLSIGERGAWPRGGAQVAEIGPLGVEAGRTYKAQYMEAIFVPGMTAPPHTHSGPEAWYTTSGETCLETPTGKHVGRAAGQPVIVPAGPPMHLTATGTEQRRAIVLILHDAAKRATTLVKDWQPEGLCRNGKGQ